jgi:hypothetical protein
MTRRDLIEQARNFTYERQRLGRAAPDAPTALREIVGVYSSHPSAPLSLWARAQEFDFASVDGLRLPAMRGSIHLLPRETAHLAFRAFAPTPSVEASRMKYFKLTPERYAEMRAKVLEAADEPRSSAELKKLAGAGDEIRYVLGAMGREGVIVRVGAEGLRSNALKWVRPEPAIGEASRAEAFAWVAGEYLRAYGPVRRADLMWWAGAQAKDADAALAQHDTIELDGGLLLRAEDEVAFERAPEPKGIDLLPKWDMLTMGYPKDGRARFAHDDVVDRCYDFRGDGMALVLVDGQAVAAWSSRFAGKRMEVDVDWFDRPAARTLSTITRAFEDVAALLGATSVSGHA